jgi:hypothetical protein
LESKEKMGEASYWRERREEEVIKPNFYAHLCLVAFFSGPPPLRVAVLSEKICAGGPTHRARKAGQIKKCTGWTTVIARAAKRAKEALGSRGLPQCQPADLPVQIESESLKLTWMK